VPTSKSRRSAIATPKSACSTPCGSKGKWPKPVGGEHGLARKSFDFDPPNDVRAPAELRRRTTSARASTRISGKLGLVQKGRRDSYEATIYVADRTARCCQPAVTPPDEDGEESVDCLVSTLKSASFPSAWQLAGEGDVQRCRGP
jgi:hypothetical protein